MGLKRNQVRTSYNSERVGAYNPDTGFLGSNLAAIKALTPEYYDYLTAGGGDANLYDFGKAPTGVQYVELVGGGRDNDFVVDWDSLRAQNTKYLGEQKKITDAKTAAEAEALAAKNAATAKRTADIGTAKNYAMEQANNIFKGAGVDPNAYGGQLTTALDRIIAGLGETADPYSAITGTVANDILNTEQNAARSNYTKEADTKFGTNYGNNLVGNNLLDPIINSILSEQKGSAQEYLDRGKARGIYNDVGYSAGTKAINSGAQAGLSQLGTLANGVVSKYQTEANSIRDKAYGAASGYTLGRNLNLDDYAQQGQAVAEKANKFGEGDLRSAFGGTQLFDFSNLTGAAGQAQGAQNLRDTDVTTALANRKKANAQGRGLGSIGAF